MNSKNFIVYNHLAAVHPSSYIEWAIEDFDYTLESFAEECGIDTKTLQLLLDAEIPVTRELGEKLQPSTGIDPDMWMRLQRGYEEDLAAIEQAKARDRERRRIRRMRKKLEPVADLASVSA